MLCFNVYLQRAWSHENCKSALRKICFKLQFFYWINKIHIDKDMFQVSCQNIENVSRNSYFPVSGRHVRVCVCVCRCQDFVYHIVHFKNKPFKSISVYILSIILIRSRTELMYVNCCIKHWWSVVGKGKVVLGVIGEALTPPAGQIWLPSSTKSLVLITCMGVIGMRLRHFGRRCVPADFDMSGTRRGALARCWKVPYCLVWY